MCLPTRTQRLRKWARSRRNKRRTTQQPKHMDTLKWQHYNEIKGFLLRILNKEFLIFMCFLVISFTFWFLSTLNDTYEKEVMVPVVLTDVPQDIVITEPLPDSMRVTLRDKGLNLFKYLIDGNLKPLQLPFATYARQNGKGGITQQEVQKLLRRWLPESTTILSVKAGHWDFYFCHGNKKRVPVVLNGSLTAKQDYYISRYTITPDSIDVLAEPNALDTINTVYTHALALTEISEPSTRDVPLKHIKGAKLAKESVRLSIITDQLTEIVIRVPVKTVNVPDNVSLKTFPAHAEVRVAVGIKNSNSIKPEQFNVVADYHALPESQSEKLRLQLLSQPHGIVKAYIKQPEVDYLLENN